LPPFLSNLSIQNGIEKGIKLPPVMKWLSVRGGGMGGVVERGGGASF